MYRNASSKTSFQRGTNFGKKDVSIQHKFAKFLEKQRRLLWKCVGMSLAKTVYFEVQIRFHWKISVEHRTD